MAMALEQIYPIHLVKSLLHLYPWIYMT